MVLPLIALALLTGLTALALTRLSARPRLFLPSAGTLAAVFVLAVAWLFPSLLGPAYQYQRQRREPAPVGLQAIPLAGAPVLAEVPEWADASRYTLQRDGMRVQILGVSLHRPAVEKGKPKPDPAELLLVRVRVSLERGAKALQRKDQPSPILTDDAGNQHPLRQSEFFDRGDGKSKAALFPVPTIEETFAFETPAEDCKTLRLTLPAVRWEGKGQFQFMIRLPDEPPRKNK